MTIPLSTDHIMPSGAATGRVAPPQPAGNTEVLPWLERQSDNDQQIALATPQTGSEEDPDSPSEESNEGTSLWGEDGFDLWDVLDIINPLQHIPIISTIYREMTGDEIGAAPRMAGGFLFGGPIGLAISGANVMVEAMSGEDIGEHAVAMWKDAVEYGQEDIAVASAAGQAPAQQASLQNDPVALARQSLASDSAGWSRIQAAAAANGNTGGNTGANAFTSANMFQDVGVAAPAERLRASPLAPAKFTPGEATPNGLGNAALSPAAFTAKSPETKWFPVNKPRNPVQPSNLTNPMNFAQANEDVTRFKDDQPRATKPKLSEAQIKSALLQAQVNSRGMNVPATSYAARKAAAEAHDPVKPGSMPVDTAAEKATRPEKAVAGTGSSLIDAQIASNTAETVNPVVAASAVSTPTAGTSGNADWFAQAMSQGLSKYQGLKSGNEAPKN